MEEKRADSRFYLSLRLKIFLAFLVFYLIVSSVTISLLGYYTYHQILGQISDDLIGTINGALASLDVENFVLLYEEEAHRNPDCPPRLGGAVNGYYPEDNPRYLAHEAWLKTVQSFSPETRIYTYVKGPRPGDIIAIGSTGYFRSPRGGFKFCELYNSNGRTRIYDGLFQRVDSWNVYTDRFGSWITTYHPITDADGDIVGAIGVDISADQVWQVRRQVVAFTLLVYAGVLLVGYFVTNWLTGFFIRPLDQLLQAARSVQRGDYDRQFQLTYQRFFDDEIQVLGRAFREMASSVSEHAAKLEESNRRLQELTRSTIEIQEQERARVARELHDHAGQVLVVLQNHLQMAFAECIGTSDSLKGQVERAFKLLEQVQEQIRALSHELHSPLLDVGDLNMALEQLCLDFSARNLQVAFEGCRNLPPLSQEVNLALFRFAQEALTNVLKHAGARNVWMRLDYASGQVVLTVMDDGRGMDKTTKRKMGLGHQAMRERLSLVGGSLEMTNVPQGGFLIRAAVPWQGVTQLHDPVTE